MLMAPENAGRICRILGIGMTLILGLVTAAFAENANIHSAGKSDGTYAEPADGRVYWAGTYWIVSYNDAGKGFGHEVVWNCPAAAQIADNMAYNQGYCTMTDRDGDKVFGTFTGQGPVGGTFEGRQDYTGGTGKYAGIAGGHDFQCWFLGSDDQFICHQQAEFNIP